MLLYIPKKVVVIKSGKKRVLSYAVLIIFVLLSVLALIPDRGEDPDEGYTSSELTKEETEENGETVITYRDESGNAAVAVNKGYAVLKKTKNSSGKTEKELYFDALGSPKKQRGGYCGITYEYSGNETLIKYLDEDGENLTLPSGYAAVRRIADGEGRTVCEFYLDEDLNPAERTGGYYGIYNEYGSDNRVTAVTCLNAEGEPSVNKSGYAKRTYLLDPEGHVVRECYFDLAGEKVKAYLGQYGEDYVRDSEGRIIRITFLDENYDPAPGKAGYSVTERTYHKNGTIDTEMYFDLAGAPFRLSKGQYGIKKENGTQLLLDKNGNVSLSVDNILKGFPYTVALIGAAISLAVIFLPKKPAAVLTCAYIVFILYETIMFREPVRQRTDFELFSYLDTFFENASTRAGVIDNIWLFVPFGAGVCRFFGAKKAVLLSFLFTAAIESTQYITALGTAELNDIFGNTLGGAIGALSVMTIKIKRNSA